MHEKNKFKEKMGEGRRHKNLILDALNSPNSNVVRRKPSLATTV
jgi:hypothetical protein